jgi:membrane-bound lytic murein transglycosylase D
MRLSKKACRFFVLCLISTLLTSVLPSIAAAQQTDPQAIINKAEALFQQGQQASEKGQKEEARKLFDQALDAVMTCGLDLRSNPKLDSYYRQLLERIHKFESGPEDTDHKLEGHTEIVEPSALDEISNVSESELATTTPDGIKIFGKYGFDFSVAPPVLQYMNFFITGRGRSTMEVGLQRSGRYRKMSEKIFKEERVPEDLIWLAQAESVWKPNALSRASAKGIWQFIPGTGQRFGLAQTQWIDQRSHPELSARAAARYLRFLHDYFAGDWMLAMAAYNSGEARVASAIARCGYADFWELFKRNLLPAETRNYVPIILSIIIISKNQKRYGFDVKPDPSLVYDTYDIPTQTDLKVVADLLGVPYESVQELNPELRRGVTPPGAAYTIKIPKGMKKQFEIAYAALPDDQRVRRIVIPSDDARDEQYRTRVVSYRVRRGDTLASLARRHGTSTEEIARLNRMSKNGQLRKGQVIRIPSSVRASRSRSKVGRYTSKKAVRSTKRGKSSIRRPTSVRRRR